MRDSILKYKHNSLLYYAQLMFFCIILNKKPWYKKNYIKTKANTVLEFDIEFDIWK